MSKGTEIFRGLKPSTLYKFKIRATKWGGKQGDWSPEKEVSTDIVGPPEQPIVNAGSEDPSTGFLFFKGWRIWWVCPTPCTGFLVRHAQIIGTYKLWTLPVYIPFRANPEKHNGLDIQEHTFAGCILGWTYEFEVVAVNNLFERKLWSEAGSSTATIVDETAPSIPTGLSVTTGPWNNIIEWTASPETDTAYYKLYGRDDDDAPDAGDFIKRTAGASTHPFVYHFWAGEVDAKDWRYYVTAVDWADNESDFSEKIQESDDPPTPEVREHNFFFGTLITWSREITDHHYDVWRKLSSEGDETYTQINRRKLGGTVYEWNLPWFVDWGQHGLGFVWGTNYDYKIETTKQNMKTAMSNHVTTQPLKPSLPDDTDGDLPESRLDLTYGTASLYSSIVANTNSIALKVSSTDYEPNDVIGKVNASSLTLTPKSITLQSSGTITLDAGKALNLTGGTINITSGTLNVNNSNGLAVGASGDIKLTVGADIIFDGCANLDATGTGIFFHPILTATKDLILGTTGTRWRDFKAYVSSNIYLKSATTILLEPSSNLHLGHDTETDNVYLNTTGTVYIGSASTDEVKIYIKEKSTGNYIQKELQFGTGATGQYVTVV